jgi:hypothetical protein
MLKIPSLAGDIVTVDTAKTGSGRHKTRIATSAAKIPLDMIALAFIFILPQ